MIAVNEGLKDDLQEVVVKTVEETLNVMLDAEAEQLCGVERYERQSPGTEVDLGVLY